MKPMIAALALLIAAASPASAQPAPTIKIVVEARSEGRATGDNTATRLLGDVRRGLEALGDIELVSGNQGRRMIWIIAGTTPGLVAASVMVTERYDRETLMVLGIEDDDMAERMMALHIVNDHQIFTGSDLADVARRIVVALNEGVLARLRTRTPKP